LSIPILLFWLLVVPMLVGLLFNFILPRDKRTVGITFILGFLISMAVFEIAAIGAMTGITFSAFTWCRRIYIAVVLILSVAGAARSLRRLRRDEKGLLSLFPGESHASARDFMDPRTDTAMFRPDYPKQSLIMWGLFFAVMIFQMVMSVVMASFDGDDAYYVVESLLAQQADVMNTILPYTGNSTSLDIRHALAVITMWIAFIAKESGIHATIVSHSVMPLFLIPLVYLVYVEIARILFRKRQELIPMFMIVTAFLMMFGNVSIYTPATFFMMRTWQGKALVANLVFPMIFWIFLWMMENAANLRVRHRTPVTIYTHREEWCGFVMLALVNMFSGVCSSMGVIFGSGLVALLTLVLLIISRNFKVLVGAFLCIIPNLVYLAIYFSLFSS
jgi:hypothetical protein